MEAMIHREPGWFVSRPQCGLRSEVVRRCPSWIPRLRGKVFLWAELSGMVLEKFQGSFFYEAFHFCFLTVWRTAVKRLSTSSFSSSCLCRPPVNFAGLVSMETWGEAAGFLLQPEVSRRSGWGEVLLIWTALNPCLIMKWRSDEFWWKLKLRLYFSWFSFSVKSRL